MQSEPEGAPNDTTSESRRAEVSAGSKALSVIAGIYLIALLFGLMVWIAPGGNTDGNYSGAGQNFHDGVAAFNAGHFAKAKSKFRKALRTDPNLAGALKYLARVYRREGRLQEAEATLIRVLVQHPNDPEIRQELGSLLLDEGRPDAAADQYREALKLDVHDRASWHGLNQALHAAGRDAEANAMIPDTMESLRR